MMGGEAQDGLLLGQQARGNFRTVAVRAVAVWPVSASSLPWQMDAIHVNRSD